MQETLETRILAFLQSHYVQHRDAHHKEMGLSYTTAETHDLAKTIARFVKNTPMHIIFAKDEA